MPEIRPNGLPAVRGYDSDGSEGHGRYLEMEYDRLISSEEGDKIRWQSDPLCNPIRFTLASLSLLVILLLAALSVLLSRDQSLDCRDYNNSYQKNATWPSVNMVADIPKQRMGIISDIHMLDAPRTQCYRHSSKYGAIGCDAPEALLNVTLDDMYKSLQENIPSQSMPFVLFLGDVSWHFGRTNVDKDTEHIIHLNQRVFDLFKERSRNIPVIATLGNNDFPQKDSLNVSEFYPKVAGMYRELADITDVSITSSDFNQTFYDGGYFSVKLVSLGIMVVSLNTLYFTTSVSDRHQREYANKQLDWMEAVLAGLDAKEKVIFIGHHPPGVSLYYLYKKKGAVGQWNSAYVERFEILHEKYGPNIIASFFGHCHTDIYNFRQNKMIAFTSPSVSPVYGGQPSYQIALLDPTSYNLLDVITYHTWLDYYTRVTTTPVFHKDASYRDILKVDRLTVESFSNASANILDETSNFRVHKDLKTKMYQDQFIPTLSPHLHYCFTSSILNSHFLDCLEEYGYNVKQFVLNGDRN